MPRYFLHIRTQDGEQFDRKGVEVMDPEAARDKAMRVAQRVVGARIYSGKPTSKVEVRIACCEGTCIGPVEYQGGFVRR
jgi:hypothetical protein